MDFLRKKVVPPPDGRIAVPPPEPDTFDDTDENGGARSIPPPFPDLNKNRPRPSLLARSRHLFNLYSGLLIGFLAFYALADYTSFTNAEMRPGQVVISDTMNQLWTACFRMTFILGASLGLLRLFWPELFEFFRPDSADDPDMTSTILFDLTPFQRLCVFLAAFFGLCLLFILVLSVNLPQTVSVGR